MSQINALTREAMGFSKDRGDTLNIANVPFISPEASGLFDLPWWRDPDVVAWATAIAKYLILAIIAFLVWTKLLKPLFQQLQRAAAEAASRPHVTHVANGLAAEAAGAAANSYETKIEQARQMAKDDPKLVANVIKEWIGGTEQR
jgi:flagellar M-ring protein FliF